MIDAENKNWAQFGLVEKLLRENLLIALSGVGSTIADIISAIKHNYPSDVEKSFEYLTGKFGRGSCIFKISNYMDDWLWMKRLEEKHRAGQRGVSVNTDTNEGKVAE